MLFLLSTLSWGQTAPTSVTTEAELLAAITGNNPIRLDADIVLSQTVAIDNYNSVTIDLNSHIIDRNCAVKGRWSYRLIKG